MEPASWPRGQADLSDGLGLLLSNSGALLYGSDQLTEGAWALRSGLGDLNRGAMALSEGTLQLRDGGKALQDGLDTFYKEGIVKLTSALQEKVPQMLGPLPQPFPVFPMKPMPGCRKVWKAR